MSRNNRNRQHEDLLEQMKCGSEQAFAQFYDAYIDCVFRLAYTLVRDQQEAEDICHDVFLEVYLKPDRYDPKRGSIQAWLAVKTRSRCLDHLRKKKPVFVPNWELFTSKLEQAPAAEWLALKNSEQQAVQLALRDIPDEQRQVLYGTYYDERTQRELAAELERPLGTIKSRIRYGLHNIKKRLVLAGWIHSGQGGGEK